MDGTSVQVAQSTQQDQEEKKEEHTITQSNTSPQTQKTHKIERKMTEDDQVLEGLALGRQVSVLSEVSAEEYVQELMKRTTRSESVNIMEGHSDASSSMMPNFQFLERRRINRSGSVYVPPQISESVLEKSEKFVKTDSALFLKDRGILRYMIQQNECEEAKKLLSSKYPNLYDNNTKVRAYLDTLRFIQLIADGDLKEAIAFSESNLKLYREHPYKVKIPTKNQQGKEIEIEVVEVTALVCYSEPEQSELGFLMTVGQRQIIASLLNNELLSKI